MKYVNTNKLEKVRLTKDNYYILLDFDKTITSKQSLDSWMAVLDFELYEKNCKKDMEKLNAKYSPIELDYSLDNETKKQYMVEWYQKSMDLLYKYQLSHSKLQKALNKKLLEFRKGAKEFLQKTAFENIPVIILSAGIGNVIEEFLKQEKVDASNIYIISNFITFKEDIMQKFDKTIIHSMNKTVKGNLPMDVQDKIKQKKYTLLCGDMVEDIRNGRKRKFRTHNNHWIFK